MSNEPIQQIIKGKIKNTIGEKNVDSFLFGSFARGGHFHDIDIGVIGATPDQLASLREDFEESTFPYEVDVIDFSSVDEQFRNNVFNSGVVWLTRKKK